MKKLQPDESRLTGGWVFTNGTMQPDDVARRIDWLVTQVLDEVAVSQQWGAWETLFRDPDDGRYWERIYPQGEMHGGGPPSLRCIPRDEAQVKYGSETIR